MFINHFDRSNFLSTSLLLRFLEIVCRESRKVISKPIGKEAVRKLEKTQVISPKSSKLTAHKKRPLIIAVSLIKIYLIKRCLKGAKAESF